MHRELFRIPGLDITIYAYGAMLVLAFLSAIGLAKFLARRHRMNPEIFVNMGMLALLGGVVGARLVHVISNWNGFFANGINANSLFDAINIRSGGLSYYGGVLCATPLCILYGIRKKLPLLRAMDIVAPCLMVGLGLGRVGCFFNGCCWGDVCNGPVAVRFPYDSPPYESHVEKGLIPFPDELLRPDETKPGFARPMTAREANRDPRTASIAAAQRSLPVHPTQLYSTITALLIAGILISYFGSSSPGQVFALMMILEGAGRFVLQLMRVHPPLVHIGGFGISQNGVIAAGLFAAGVVFWLVVRLRTGK